jgi:DNA-binding MarR family transcriptional regulator
MFDPSLNYGLLPSLTGFALRRASLFDFARFGEAVGEKAITPLRYSMLEIVGANPGLQQAQLADILGLSRPATTIAIDFWEERKCISRRRDDRDRRSYGIFLTKVGEETLSELQRRVREHDSQLTDALSASELAALRASLRKIYED